MRGRYFYPILKGSGFNIVKWVDKNYKRIPQLYKTPITDPEGIRPDEIDAVFVTPQNGAVVLQIREFLVEAGVPEKKIFVFA